MWTAALFLRASTSSPSVCGWELCLRCVSCSDIPEFLVLGCALSSWEQLGAFRGCGASSCNLWIKYLYLIVPSCYNEFNDHTVAKENNSHYSSLYNSAILNSFNFRENISLLKASNTYRVCLRKKIVLVAEQFAFLALIPCKRRAWTHPGAVVLIFFCPSSCLINCTNLWLAEIIKNHVYFFP